jgi:hypothetical protein
MGADGDPRWQQARLYVTQCAQGRVFVVRCDSAGRWKARATMECYVRPGRAAELRDYIELDLYGLRRSYAVQQHVHCEWPLRLCEDLGQDRGLT